MIEYGFLATAKDTDAPVVGSPLPSVVLAFPNPRAASALLCVGASSLRGDGNGFFDREDVNLPVRRIMAPLPYVPAFFLGLVNLIGRRPPEGGVLPVLGERVGGVLVGVVFNFPLGLDGGVSTSGVRRLSSQDLSWSMGSLGSDTFSAFCEDTGVDVPNRGLNDVGGDLDTAN